MVWTPRTKPTTSFDRDRSISFTWDSIFKTWDEMVVSWNDSAGTNWSSDRLDVMATQNSEELLLQNGELLGIEQLKTIWTDRTPII